MSYLEEHSNEPAHRSERIGDAEASNRLGSKPPARPLFLSAVLLVYVGCTSELNLGRTPGAGGGTGSDNTGTSTGSGTSTGGGGSSASSTGTGTGAGGATACVPVDWEKTSIEPAGGSWAQNTSIAVGDDGTVHITYANDASELRYSSKSPGGNFKTSTLATSSSYADITIDGQGGLHVAYNEFGIGKDDLRYAHRPVDGSWVDSLVEAPGSVGWSPSIGVDAAGNIHISHWNFDNHSLLYTHRPVGGTFAGATVDDGVEGRLDLAVDSKGVHLAYKVQQDVPSKGANYAFRAVGSATWEKSVIEASGPAILPEEDHGNYPSIALDKDGGVHIVYQLGTLHLKYAHRPPGGSWGYALLDDFAGTVTSIRVDSGGGVHVVYSTADEPELRYLHRPAGADWEPVAVIDQGADASLALDASGGVHVSYLAGAGNNVELRYAYRRMCD